MFLMISNPVTPDKHPPVCVDMENVTDLERRYLKKRMEGQNFRCEFRDDAGEVRILSGTQTADTLGKIRHEIELIKLHPDWDWAMAAAAKEVLSC